ncbi:FAD dependent oxidoreductase [Aulographum hederae CBS 113979]|uniref:FAD dependent oxidoreductase n=1 Tax=Aulographum hederae CBS 113979 TaxID=1176131 RepID=A0A6G1H959_9PEZI|nr:FAD dependent oxidoreductase [Aulographum hederae CBS 113979]
MPSNSRNQHLPLRMWRDLTPLGLPFHPPAENAPHVLVIGGGVTGLTTAWLLLDQGKKVTVVSRDWASHAGDTRLTSQIAGALWEYPPAVCGQHEGKVSLEESKRWAMVSLHAWSAIAEDPEISALAGVQLRKANFFFPTNLDNDEIQLNKMNEIMASGVKGFRRSAGLAKECGVNPEEKIADAYQILSPIIDSDQGMQWLMKLVQDKGAKLTTETIRGDLHSQEAELLGRFNAQAIVNATGLGAKELATDPSCYPVRGALLRAVNDGVRFPKVEQAITLSADVSGESNEIVFIVPRNDNTLLMGGIAEDREGDMNLTLDSPTIQNMRKHCENFLPQLKTATLHPSYPLAVGLRPFRGGNVRVERELRPQRNGSGSKPSRIVHSYGQGGAGWTLAFGCASEAAQLVDEALLDRTPKPMEVEALASLLSSSPTGKDGKGHVLARL